MKAMSPKNKSRVTSFLFKQEYLAPAPVIHSRAVKYRSDGSGRDLYVGINDGGLHAPGSKTIEYRDAFKRSLRV